MSLPLTQVVHAWTPATADEWREFAFAKWMVGSGGPKYSSAPDRSAERFAAAFTGGTQDIRNKLIVVRRELTRLTTAYLHSSVRAQGLEPGSELLASRTKLIELETQLNALQISTEKLPADVRKQYANNLNEISAQTNQLLRDVTKQFNQLVAQSKSVPSVAQIGWSTDVIAFATVHLALVRTEISLGVQKIFSKQAMIESFSKSEPINFLMAGFDVLHFYVLNKWVSFWTTLAWRYSRKSDSHLPRRWRIRLTNFLEKWQTLGDSPSLTARSIWEEIFQKKMAPYTGEFWADRFDAIHLAWMTAGFFDSDQPLVDQPSLASLNLRLARAQQIMTFFRWYKTLVVYKTLGVKLTAAERRMIKLLERLTKTISRGTLRIPPKLYQSLKLLREDPSLPPFFIFFNERMIKLFRNADTDPRLQSHPLSRVAKIVLEDRTNLGALEITGPGFQKKQLRELNSQELNDLYSQTVKDLPELCNALAAYLLDIQFPAHLVDQEVSEKSPKSRTPRKLFLQSV